ncbi:hypothetical protein [Sulfobacillus thermosulfidooxidans]|uniref:hypothetical protein n=1 Tax=Sulfobacillus thermosulfidooxidans TaxID=28034 RepID=UPI0006B453C0|nr:hypothetical protein [Sulfobacillus thermosulfidooxidans]
MVFSDISPSARRWLLGGVGAAIVGWMGIGFTVGAWLAPTSRVTAASSTSTFHPTTPSATPPSSAGPWTIGQTAPWSAPLTTLSGHATHLARGSHGTIVMAMASWCLFCGYEDRWVWPQMAREHPHWAIDIVDVSPQGGIADPGPQNPPFHGHDGVGGPLTVAQMQATMRQYVSTYPLQAANIHVYVAPSPTQSAWHIGSFPTIYAINRQGIVQQTTPGAVTLTQAAALFGASHA